MIGCTIGSLVALGSGYITKVSFDSMKEIQKNKNKLKDNVVPFENINSVQNGLSSLTVIDNETRAGILNLYEKRITTVNNIMIGGNTRPVRTVTHFDEEWENIFSKKVNLNFDVANFVPPKELSNILFTFDDMIKIKTSSPSTMTSLISKDYNIDVCLPSNGIYVAKFLSFENKQVFAYGENNNNKFNATIMGTSSKMVANKIYEDEQNVADIGLVIGISGVIGGLVTVCNSISK